MRIGELARQANVTAKTVRYYESVGLLEATRLPNGYRDYDERQVRLVREIRELNALGIRVEQTRPFLECLISGHRHGDDCPDSRSTYRAVIDDLGERIDELSSRRDALVALLASAERTEPRCEFSHP